MPKLSFRGFTAGSLVALSAAQGANSTSGSVTTWGQAQNHMGSLNILSLAPSASVAPVGIWFEAVDIAGFDAAGGPAPGETYDPSYHEITYIWTINGAPLAPYQAPQNMVSGWNDPNTAYGKKVAFHFPDPGTYEIELWAVDRSGNTGVANTVIVVGDADSLYPGTQTVCFSNASGENWAGEVSGCQRATSFNDLQNAIDTAGGPLRILFKRGQVVTEPETSLLLARYSNQWMNHIGAWGSGAKPVVHAKGTGHLIQLRGTNPVTHFTCENIDFQGGWDAPSETGVPSTSPFIFIMNETPCHYTISRCTFDGMSSVWLSAGPQPGTMVVADCVATNWRDYGSFIHNGDQQRFALIGSRFQQHVDAQNGNVGGAGKNGMYNDHGPIRWSYLNNAYLACSDFFSRNGWSGAPPDLADQPCIRANSNIPDGYTPSFTLDRCVCEGGFQVVAIEGHSTNIPERPGNYLLDRALLIATPKTFKSFVTVEYGGTTIRNVIGVIPDVPAYHPNAWTGPVIVEAQSPVAGNLDEPIQLYGNSFINLRNTANDPGHAWPEVNLTGAFTDTTFENNVAHGPNLDTAVNGGNFNMGTSIPGVSPRYKGVLYNEFGQENGTFGGTIGSGGSFTLPYPSGTNQAYWQAIAGIDTRHQIIADGSRYHAEQGDIAVTFEGSAVRITNLSGGSWNAGSSWILKLDRKSMRSSIPSVHANPASLPLPRPTSAIGSGLGLIPHDDFMRVERNGSAGAVEP